MFNVSIVRIKVARSFIGSSKGLEDIGFAAGMVQALHIGEFLYSNSSTPSNSQSSHFTNKLQTPANSKWITLAVN